ncbi:hypothetical protein [Jejuia pallidilutea]|uniref:hypothetical protein n=1 Tax=Jejuia pallidilutea TaxID=504487 RepID=UPI001EE6D0AF|nr:hypothetical protein [Jejuia pallidilutea]
MVLRYESRWFNLDDKRNLLVDKDTFEQCFTHPETMVEAVKGKCDIPQILLDAKVIMNSTSLRGGTTKQSHETTAIAGNAKQSHHTKFSDRTQQSFTVPFEEIKANDWDLSINRYKEMVYEEIEYEKPETLIAQIKDLDKQRNDALLNLEKMMG